MRLLRNKKTGEIGELRYYPDKEYHFAVSTKDPTQTGIYKTLGELLRDWTDFIVHEPAEPLIKDPKIRKVVRAWAEANNLMRNKLQIVPLRPSDGAYNDSGIICNGSALMSITLIHGIGRGLRGSRKSYTITELCGDEE